MDHGHILLGLRFLDLHPFIFKVKLHVKCSKHKDQTVRTLNMTEWCPFCYLPHHPRERTSSDLIGYMRTRKMVRCAPHYWYPMFWWRHNQMKLSFKPPQGPSKDEEWSSSIIEKTMHVLNRNFSVIEHLKSQLVIAIIFWVLKTPCPDQGQWVAEQLWPRICLTPVQHLSPKAQGSHFPWGILESKRLRALWSSVTCTL